MGHGLEAGLKTHTVSPEVLGAAAQHSKKEGWAKWVWKHLPSPFGCFKAPQVKTVRGKDINASVIQYSHEAKAGRDPKVGLRQFYADRVASALAKEDHDRAARIFKQLISTWNRSDSDVAPTYARSMVQDALKTTRRCEMNAYQEPPIEEFGLLTTLQSDAEKKHFAELIKKHPLESKSFNKIEQLKIEAEADQWREPMDAPGATTAGLISFYIARVNSELSKGNQDQACRIFEQLESPWRKAGSALETKMSAATALYDHAKNNVIPTLLKASAADGNNDENACLRKEAIEDLERKERELAKAIAIVEDYYNRVVECRDNLGNDVKPDGLRGLIVERETLIKNAKEQQRAMLTILDSLAQQHIEQLIQLEEKCKQNNKVSPTLFHLPFMEQLHYERFLLAKERVAFAKKLNNIESKEPDAKKLEELRKERESIRQLLKESRNAVKGIQDVILDLLDPYGEYTPDLESMESNSLEFDRLWDKEGSQFTPRKKERGVFGFQHWLKEQISEYKWALAREEDCVSLDSEYWLS